MATWKVKQNKQVDAELFAGDVTASILSVINGSAILGYEYISGPPRQLKIKRSTGTYTVNSGQYVIRNPDGTFAAMDQAAFEDKHELNTPPQGNVVKAR